VGNNNAYCQDNETSWFDWSLLEKHSDIYRFVTMLNARRMLRDLEPERHRMSLNELIRQASKEWHGVKLHLPDWSYYSHSLALSAQIPGEEILMHVIINGYWEPLDFELPLVGKTGPWRRWIDTYLDSPQDIVEWGTLPVVPGFNYKAKDRSVVVLLANL
jgi:glycogen operon protein